MSLAVMQALSSSSANKVDAKTTEWLSSSLPQLERLGRKAEIALSAISEDTTSPYTRYVLYYGVDAIAVATAAHLALKILGEKLLPSQHAAFPNLFTSSADGLHIELAAFAGTKLYFPSSANRLSTADTLKFTPTAANPSRQVQILNSDYVNVFYGRPPEQVIPALLLRQTWTAADFDDPTRAATLLIAGIKLWSAATDKYAHRSKAQDLPIPAAVAKLLTYYSTYMQAIGAESMAHKNALALGTAYIEQARQNEAKGDGSSLGLTEAQRELQMAAFGIYSASMRPSALKQLTKIAAGEKFDPLTLQAQNILSAEPGKFITPPENKKNLPQRPPVKVTLPKSTSDHAPSERQPTEVKATVARRAQSTSQSPAAATTADNKKTNRSLTGKFERLLDVLARLSQEGKFGTAAFTLKLQSVSTLLTQAPAAIAKAAELRLKRITDSASPATKKHVIIRDRESPITELRDALADAYRHGEPVSITLFSGNKHSGQLLYGNMQLDTVGLIDLGKGLRLDIRLKDIKKLQLSSAASPIGSAAKK